jgi:DNA-binding response OmpR family regulator
VTEKHYEVRVLALVAADRQAEIRRQLAPIGVTLVFISRALDLSHLARDRTLYDVALLPAALPDTDWWAVWGEISLLNPRPAILVYAHSASFQLWSGVLEVGGYDVIVEPFSSEELQGAVLQAAKSFEDRALNENE